MAAALIPSDMVLLGVVGRPHGVRGHVHVCSYTADPQDLAAYGALRDASGRRFTLRWIGGDVAELAELTPRGPERIVDRNAAGRLTNRQLFVDRAALPDPDDDEFYLADLIGLAAVSPGGEPVGKVAVLHDYGAGASLEIAAAGGPILIPFTRACVPEIDLPARRLVVCPPAEIQAADSP